MKIHYQPLRRSDINDDDEQLRRRIARDGYLYLPGAVGDDQCQRLLAQIIGRLQPYVGFDTAAQLPLLTGEPFVEGDGIWNEVYPRLQSLPALHQFFHSQDALALMRRIADATPFVYPMKMARISTPRRVGGETPPHQDAHSHQAGPTMCGIWVALHDVRAGMGRLMLLPGSHRQGVRRVFPVDGVGGIQCEVFAHEDTWHVSDVARGDAIVFHACCVHRAEPNLSEATVRMSVDTRFCDYGAPVFSANLLPHYGSHIPGLDWQAIYRDWGDTELQHYWRDYPHVFHHIDDNPYWH